MTAEKVCDSCEVGRRIAEWHLGDERIVFTNGCFDLLHPGHVLYLEAAKALGDRLIVAINSDASVKALKGPGRPMRWQDDRAAVIAGLESVDLVCVFDAVRVDGLLAAWQPDIWVKGGDYTLDTLDQGERRAAEAYGGKIVFIPCVGNHSTSRILAGLGQAHAYRTD